MLFYGGSEIIAGTKTVGDFMAFFTAIALAFEPLRRLGAVSGSWQIAAASIERLKELLDTVPDLRDPPSPRPAPEAVPEVVLDKVTLRYGDQPVLRGASFVAEARKTTALVGASGAGKSTVFNAITQAKAEAGNYMFTASEPNFGVVQIPDPRLEIISQLVPAKKTSIPFK